MSVIIVGGGMAGATFALAFSHLTQGKLAVHLVEANAPSSQDHPGFDTRTIALAAATCQKLARIGVWQTLASCATPISTVHVSDRGHAGFVTLSAEDYQLDALGQVVELHEVGQRLFKRLQNAPGVTLHCPDRVEHFTRNQQQVTVRLQSGEQLTGELLVAADGSRSSIAGQLNIDWQQSPYDQAAVIANVTTSVAHQGRAFERFTEYGPLAMLPMSQGRCSLVWCYPREKQQQVVNWSDEQFCHELQKAFGWRLGHILHAGKRSVYPLALSTTTSSVSHRAVLVGNAAQTLHPIAGQGFNLGMRDVMTLAESLSHAFVEQGDVGSYPVLLRYSQHRQADKNATIGITDGLVHLFANRWAPLVVGRNLGLMAMELFTPARDALVQRTLGWIAR